MVVFRDSETVRARKLHICDECLTHIVPGELYVRSAGHNGDDFYTWKAHPDCEEAGQKLWRMGGYEYDEYSPVWEQIDDAGDDRFYRWFALAYPTVWERVRKRFEDHNEGPLSHFVWSAPLGNYYDVRRPYRWVEA